MDLQKLYNYYISAPYVTIDSREKVNYGIFFGLKGENTDGGMYARQALENGCTLAVVGDDKYVTDKRIVKVRDVLGTLQDLAKHHRKQKNMPFFALTGTNGKTTTKELIAKVLESRFKVGFTRGNLNNHIGVPLTLLNMDDNIDIAVIEMGANHRGDIQELCNIALPTHGLITNIGKAHLEGFGSEEVILQTKCELFESLAERNGVAFVNTHDERLVACSKKLNLNSRFFHSQDSVYANIPEQHTPLLAIELLHKNQSSKVNSHLSGVYNADNMVAAAAVGLAFGISLDAVSKQLSAYVPHNNRSQYTHTENNQLIVDAYNANPTSMLLAIENLRNIRMNGVAKLLILGDMFELGKDSLLEHQKVVDALNGNFGENVWLVGDMFGKTNYPSNFKHFPSTDVLLDYIKSETIKDKLILIKGSRGMKLERCLELL
jgi:UDP-N-acetylmuramoyl-tripeptide--D-alanyl-D-alanine ligase